MSKQSLIGIRLEEVTREEVGVLMPMILTAFEAAIIEGVGEMDDSIMIREDMLMCYIAEPRMVVYKALMQEQVVGAVILRLSPKSKHNTLELLCVDVKLHCKGIGVAIWQAIEALYPDTDVWETETPDFSKRNIHFYVNKCGFHIVEYFNRAHQSDEERAQHAYDQYGKFHLEKKRNSF